MPTRISDWKDFGSLEAINNTTAETTVDTTFRKITAFNTLGEFNGMTGSTTTNNIVIDKSGTYMLVGTAKLDVTPGGSDIVINLFVNDTDTNLGMSDKGDGNMSVSTIITLTGGDTVSAYQKSAAATALTINSITLTLVRVL